MTVFKTKIIPESNYETAEQPRVIPLITSDNLATITTAGYLNTKLTDAVSILKTTDVFNIWYGYVSAASPGTYQVFTITVSSGVITLVADVSEGDVLLPVVSGNLASFNGTTGQIKDSLLVAANMPINATAGALTLPNALNTSYPLIVTNVTVGAPSLTSGATVNLLVSSGSHQYQIINLILNKVGTNFSGGGGDRLGQITDGTSVFSVIPAATMQTLTNSLWGSTAVAAPASVSYSTPTAVGATLGFKYSGGTTDYLSGSLSITVVAIQIT